ncbi:MAG: hypothetical protein PHW04_09860 [Candidatus Wallbacteria bacterium]|nr:hypothetical protein [Candidatus Wallbacteria bacterium]
MQARRIKASVGLDNKIVLYLPDIEPGEVEVIVLKEDNGSKKIKLGSLPKHHCGEIKLPLCREHIYKDER